MTVFCHIAPNGDIEDELAESSDYPRSRKDVADERSADERIPSAWESWRDRQNSESAVKDADGLDSFTEENTNDDFEKPVQSAVKRSSGPEEPKYHPTVLQIDPLSGDVNRNNLDKKNSGSHHPTRCSPHSQYHPPFPTSHHRQLPPQQRSANLTPTETILVQEPYRLDNNEIYSVCDVDGNWSWPLSQNEGKKWLRWLWVLPCLLLGILMFFLFVKTCQNYAEQRVLANARCRDKTCHFQDHCQSAVSPLIRPSLEPQRYPPPTRPVHPTSMGQMMRQMGHMDQMSQMGHMNQMSQMGHMNQMSQMGHMSQMSHMNQISQRASQMSQLYPHRQQSMCQNPQSMGQNSRSISQSPRLQPQRMPSMASNLSKIGKAQKLIYTSPPPQFTVRTQSAFPCPYSTPPTPQTPLQQQCTPRSTPFALAQHFQHSYASPSRISQCSGFVAPNSRRVAPTPRCASPRLTRQRLSSPKPQSSASEEGSRSPSPKPPS
nr:PREDICTED: uncharacterized protein LOC109036345 [Bemisia tabaci]